MGIHGAWQTDWLTEDRHRLNLFVLDESVDESQDSHAKWDVGCMKINQTPP